MNSIIKHILLIIVLSMIALHFAACKKKNNPIEPQPVIIPTIVFTPTPTFTGYCGSILNTCTFTETPTLTPTPTPQNIVWYGAEVVRIDFSEIGIAYEYAIVDLRVNSQPETTANVAVTGTNGSYYNLPYQETNDKEGVTYASYYILDGFNYIPGVTYTFITDTSAGIATAYITAPGNIIHSPDGLSSSWAVEGNNDFVMVTDWSYNSLFIQGVDSVSPVYIPEYVYSWCGYYILSTQCRNYSSSAYNATVIEGIYAFQDYSTGVTVSSNCTPIPTPTPT